MKKELISDYADAKPNVEKRDTGIREKTMRIARGLEPEDVAEYLDITVEQLKEIEAEGEFSDEQLRKLNKFFGASYSFMCTGINEDPGEEGLL